MDNVTYSLTKKIAASALSGVQSMSVSGQTLTINTKDSGVLTMTFPTPKDGVSVTDIDVNANNQIVFTMSDGSTHISGKIPTVKGDSGEKGDAGKSAYELAVDNGFIGTETEYLESLKGSKGDDGFNPTITENADNTDKIYKLDITTADSTFTTPNLKGADGQGGSGGTGEENKIDSISVNGVNVPIDENKNVDITVPEAYDDTDIRAELAKKADTDHTHTTVNGHTVESDVPVDAKFTDTVYDDTQVKSQIQAVANGLMDSVGYSADYKTIDIIAKNGVKKSVNVAPIISHASITELSDVDTTNKATGKALVYNAITSKHEYADVSGTDEKVKMDSSTDAKYLGELLDNVTIANENGELKVKKLDGQEVTITEINYLKGLTMNVMDLVNMFSNGGVKIINTPVATYAELLTIDKSSFIEGVSYLVYVLADENHDNAKTTYLVDKDSETPTYFGFADSQRDFTTNPIDLATEITGKLGISNMDSDAIKALFTVDDTYKTETATNNAFSTHGAKALYDELLLAIGNKANSSDLTTHKDDTDIHVSTEDRTNWDTAKTHADSAHAPSNAQENVLETVKVNGTALTPSSKAVNIDLSDYAKTTDIPTTLPADGGNANTVNNHTVKSDVPENAVFTDTIYDDTEVKESIEELNSNLTQLEYSDVAGGRNIFQLEKRKCGSMVGNDLVLAHQVGEFYEYDWKPNTQYTISFVGRNSTSNGRQRLYFKYTDGSDGEAITNYETSFAYVSVTSEAGKTIKSINSYWGADGSLIIKDAEIMIEEGTKATPYEPYIPSVKMLASENAQQSSDLDGLGYGENGAKNLFEDEIKWIENITVERGTKSVSDGKITLTATSDDCYTHHSANTWKNNGIKTIPCKPNTTYTLSWEYEGDSIGDVYIFENGSTNNIGYTINKSHKLLITTSADAEYLTVRVGVRNSGTSITYWNFQLEEGDTATPYEPYIPSVKMLAEENEQQNTEAMDLKMLGWTVPSECPVQNYVDSDGVFHQRVGRVDLGSLSWTYDTLWKATSGVSNIKIFTVNMYHSVYVPTIANVSDMPTNSVKKADSGTLWINNGSSTEKPSGYLYFELAEEKSIKLDGNEVVTKVNDSLDAQGLLNKFDGDLLVGSVYASSDGSLTTNYTYVCNRNKIYCYENDIVHIRTKNTAQIIALYYNENEYISYEIVNSNQYDFIVPSGTTYMNFDIQDNTLSPSDIHIYINNEIEQIKNDLSVKKFELVAGTLWLCVSGKHCVLTLNGYNLTESTHFDKLEEYQPYLVARNVVSKGDSVCIAAVEPNGNINASDLVVGTQLTGQLFGEISWIANI